MDSAMTPRKSRFTVAKESSTMLPFNKDGGICSHRHLSYSGPQFLRGDRPILHLFTCRHCQTTIALKPSDPRVQSLLGRSALMALNR